MVLDQHLFNHGTLLRKKIFQMPGIGEMSMESTIFHGTKINIFQFTVDHAGLKVLPLLLLTDSIS